MKLTRAFLLLSLVGRRSLVHADCPDKDSGEEFCEKSGFGKDECEDNAACCHWDDGACWYNEGGDGVSSSSNDGGDGVSCRVSTRVLVPAMLSLIASAASLS